MPIIQTIQPAVDLFDKFINIATELAKLPQLVLPQYQAAAQDLYEISQKLLTANENVSHWLYKFLYFDFQQHDARAQFLNLVRDYKTMKQGAEFQQLKFSCAGIYQIYHRNIASKLGNWFSSRTKLNEAQNMFGLLSGGDADMISFIYDQVVKALDNAVDDMEKCVEASAFDDAEMRRLQTKADMKDVTERLPLSFIKTRQERGKELWGGSLTG
jgi:hypothetical protein